VTESNARRKVLDRLHWLLGENSKGCEQAPHGDPECLTANLLEHSSDSAIGKKERNIVNRARDAFDLVKKTIIVMQII
jgi:hypothetical protein